MNSVFAHDTLAIVNGPEDGIEFALVRTPTEVGRDLTCPVHIQLDGAVEPQHAVIFGSKNGYRVRAMTGKPVYVNGKRASMYRSRFLSNGDELGVGYTLLRLSMGSGAPANRRRGKFTDSDAVRVLGDTVGGMARAAVNVFIVSFPRFLLRHKKLATGAVLVAVWYFVPAFSGFVYDLVDQAAAFIRRTLANLW